MRACWPIAVVLAACYGPSVSPGAPCGPSGECPSGLDCIGGRCLPPGTLDDAAPIDDTLADTTMVAIDAPADANPMYVPWGTAVVLTSLELAVTGETDPSATQNRLGAVLTADSPNEIYECTRPALTDTFTCAAIAAVNSSSNDKSSEISADGATLYFSSNRSGSYEIYTSIKGQAGWALPTVVPQLSTAQDDSDVGVSPDGLTAVVVRNGGTNHLAIHTRASTALPFDAGTVHAELEISGDVAAPSVTNGGAAIYFHAGGTRDLYVAYKRGNGTYTMPSPIDELNTSGRDAAPFVTNNDRYMIFERESDIYEATRP